MANATKPARSRPSQREVPVPYREVKHLIAERFQVPMAIHGTGSKGGGREFYPNIEGLRLRDGSERFHCTAVRNCQHTYTTYGKVRYHIGKEHPNPKKVAARARKAAAAAPAAELVLPEPAPEPAPAPAPEPEPEPAPAPEPAAAPAPVVVPSPDTPLTEDGLDELVRTFGVLAESRNGWRERCEAAEKLAAAEKERADRAEKNLADLQARLRKLTEG